MPDDDAELLRPASPPRHEVVTRLGVWIPARDGVQLSANLWLPVPLAEAAGTRFPAILEMIPYGKDNWRRNADVARGTYLAQRGYVLCRLDVRGTGSSGGIAIDEYTEDESATGTTRSSGWRPSLGAPARSGCGGSATAASSRSRWLSSARRICAQSSRSRRPTIAT